MAERGSLMRMKELVNRGAAIAALFLLTSCGGEEQKVEEISVQRVSSPIVWQTPIFDEEISSFSVSDENPVLILLAKKSKGIDLINVDGAEITETGPHFASDLGSGVYADFGDTSLRLFPGIDEKTGNLTVYAYGSGLKAPIELALSPGVDAYVKGLCATKGDNESELMKIGYWTELDNSTLVLGSVSSTDGELSFSETGRIRNEKYLTSCALDEDLVATGGGFGLSFKSGDEEAVTIDLPGVPVSMAALADIKDGMAAVTLSGGKVMLSDTKGNAVDVVFEAGLSSPVPDAAGDLSLSRAGTVGSLPDGFLAVESQTSKGSQIIYVDLKNLTDQL
jgi:hypothetical protein